jgi:hypothetical protein
MNESNVKTPAGMHTTTPHSTCFVCATAHAFG